MNKRDVGGGSASVQVEIRPKGQRRHDEQPPALHWCAVEGAIFVHDESVFMGEVTIHKLNHYLGACIGGLCPSGITQVRSFQEGVIWMRKQEA